MRDGIGANEKKVRKNHPTEPRVDLSLAAPASLVRELDGYCQVHRTDRSKAVRTALRLLLDSTPNT